MKRSKFTESQIIFALREAESASFFLVSIHSKIILPKTSECEIAISLERYDLEPFFAVRAGVTMERKCFMKSISFPM
jgi:hypothetical protein